MCIATSISPPATKHTSGRFREMSDLQSRGCFPLLRQKLVHVRFPQGHMILLWTLRFDTFIVGGTWHISLMCTSLKISQLGLFSIDLIFVANFVLGGLDTEEKQAIWNTVCDKNKQWYHKLWNLCVQKHITTVFYVISY